MRLIRFRAWNRVDKTMYTDAVNNCKDSFDMVLKHPQIYEVMQYTGLKDKNGVEIYEGDYVLPRYNGFDKIEVKYYKGKYNIAAYLLKQCEVVGNIYE